MPRRMYLVGAGTIARAHAKAARKLPGDVELLAADPDSDARSGFQEAFPEAMLFDDTDEMLAGSAHDSDVVVVAPPPFAHRDAAVAALESGRHVLCEKPLGLDLDEVDEMLATAREADRLLGSCNCRFDEVPSTNRVIELLDEGAIGEPYHVRWVDRQPRSRSGIEYQPESRWFVDASRSGGGILMDWGPYDVHNMVRVLGPDAITVEDAWIAQPVTEVDPDLTEGGVTNDVEQHVGATLRAHQNDRDVPITYERAACTHGEAGRTFEIEGTEGALAWEWKPWEDESAWHARDEDGERVVDRLDLRTGPALTFQEVPLVSFVREVDGQSTTLSRGEEARFEFAMVRAIYDCAASGESRTVGRAGTGETADGTTR